MKYKKGSIVEVLDKDGFCNKVWRCAQIVSRNDHNYTVSYDVYPGFTDEEDVEHLYGKFIRPLPPIVEVLKCWVPGDEVELFHDLAWKMAIVLDDCSWNGYLVRLVGSLEELEVTKRELRVRQSYQNEQPQIERVGYLSSKMRKRASPCCYTQDEENEERPLKFRVSGKDGRRLIVLGTSMEMVDDVTNNRDMKENINGTNGSETDSVVSSSGSCSTNGCKPNDMYCRTSHDRDAESACQSDTDKAWADEIQRQELNAYRFTLDALYSSGPLTWEKETMSMSGQSEKGILKCSRITAEVQQKCSRSAAEVPQKCSRSDAYRSF
nr:hypothetical protein [Tanacetum cinerariifolium]